MPTLEPGVYDPEEAPWWEFSCEDFPTVRKQWMGEAAAHFAQLLANRSAGGKFTVSCLQTTIDGNAGLYEVKMDLHRLPELINVSRGAMVSKPTEGESLK